MEKIEFKSQVATSIKQSKHLLKLGLKKETADMMYIISAIDGLSEPLPYESSLDFMLHIPAWSLHRLMEMYGDNYNFFSLDNAYGELIHAIAIDIENGDFNKDYLEEKK